MLLLLLLLLMVLLFKLLLQILHNRRLSLGRRHTTPVHVLVIANEIECISQKERKKKVWLLGRMDASSDVCLRRRIWILFSCCSKTIVSWMYSNLVRQPLLVRYCQCLFDADDIQYTHFIVLWTVNNIAMMCRTRHRQAAGSFIFSLAVR